MTTEERAREAAELCVGIQQNDEAEDGWILYIDAPDGDCIIADASVIDGRQVMAKENCIKGLAEIIQSAIDAAEGRARRGERERTKRAMELADDAINKFDLCVNDPSAKLTNRHAITLWNRFRAIERELDAARLAPAALRDAIEWGRELEDWKAERAEVVAEECAPDEKHCACVPALRRELNDLKQWTELYLKAPEESRATIVERYTGAKALDPIIASWRQANKDQAETIRIQAAEIARLTELTTRQATNFCPICEANAKEAERLRGALEPLITAAQHRENTMGDPCRLLEVKANLARAAEIAAEALKKGEGDEHLDYRRNLERLHEQPRAYVPSRIHDLREVRKAGREDRLRDRLHGRNKPYAFRARSDWPARHQEETATDQGLH